MNTKVVFFKGYAKLSTISTKNPYIRNPLFNSNVGWNRK